MVWAIVAVAIIVLALGAWAGAGHLGEMPEPVTDRPKPHIPVGPVDRAFLDEMRIPRVGVGYSPAQVDAYLAGFVSDEPDRASLEQVFDVVRGGYDMQAIDLVLERMAAPAPHPEPGPADIAGGPGGTAPDDPSDDPSDSPTEQHGEAPWGPEMPSPAFVGDNGTHDQSISKD